jgi:hypothetical protein
VPSNFPFIFSPPLILACACAASPVQANGGRGDLGEISQASLLISVSVAERIRITGLQDVSQKQLSSLGEPLTQTMCLWSSTNTGTYSVKVEGSGSDGALSLSGPDQAELPYLVQWSSSKAPESAELAAGSPLNGVAPSGSDPACPNGALRAGALQISMNGAAQPFAAQQFAGTLAIVAAPE